jgi:thioredoxin reductase (NADPH)
MAGAAPRTEWLEDSFVLDKKGFVVTGPDLIEYANFQWPLSRSPLLLETSVPGIFAVGDTRAGSIKRVASAVGEGAMAVHLVHRFLAESIERDKAAGNGRTDLGHGVVDSLQPKILAQGGMR